MVRITNDHTFRSRLRSTSSFSVHMILYASNLCMISMYSAIIYYLHDPTSSSSIPRTAIEKSALLMVHLASRKVITSTLQFALKFEKDLYKRYQWGTPVFDFYEKDSSHLSAQLFGAPCTKKNAGVWKKFFHIKITVLHKRDLSTTASSEEIMQLLHHNILRRASKRIDTLTPVVSKFRSIICITVRDQLEIGLGIWHLSVSFPRPFDDTVANHSEAEDPHQNVQLCVRAEVRAVRVRDHRSCGLPQPEVGERCLFFSWE